MAIKQTDYHAVGTPGIVRSYVSGVYVGRLVAGEDDTVVLRDSRWLRSWQGVGNKGSIEDLLRSGVTPQDRGDLREAPRVLSQADFLSITEDQYRALAE